MLVLVSNLGDEAISGDSEPVIITDKLPAGLSCDGDHRTAKNNTQVECSLPPCNVRSKECSPRTKR